MKKLKKALPKFSAKKGLSVAGMRIGTKTLLAGAALGGGLALLGGGNVITGATKAGGFLKAGASKLGSVFKKAPTMAPSLPAIGTQAVEMLSPNNAGLAVSQSVMGEGENLAYTTPAQVSSGSGTTVGNGLFDVIARFLDSIFGVKK